MRAPSAVPALLALLPLVGCATISPYREVVRQLPSGSLIEIRDSNGPRPGQPRRVHVVDRGPRAATQNVVLLHGFGASSASWRLVQPHLSENYRTLAIDLNGFGWSERPRDDASYTLDGQADLVLGVLDALGIESAHFVGHSYGGAVSQWLATRSPQRVRSLVLLDSASPVYSSERRSRAAAFRPLADLYLRLVALKPRFVRSGLENSFHDRGLVTDELVSLYLEPLRVEGTLFAYRALSKPNDIDPKTFDASRIRQPTLALWGEHDRQIPVAAARRATAPIADLRFVVLPGAAHNPHEEKPAETARAILDFWSTVPTPR